MNKSVLNGIVEDIGNGRIGTKLISQTNSRLGHEVGALNEAYKSVQFESLRKMYLDREKLISISTPKIDVEEIKEKLKTEIDLQNRQLQVLVNSLVTENMDLKRRTDLTGEKLQNIEKLVQDLRKTVDS